MITATLINSHDGWYREPTHEFNLCVEGITQVLGTEPAQIKITASQKPFKGSQRAVWWNGYLYFGKHKVNPSASSIVWAQTHELFSFTEDLTIYIKIEPLP